MIHLLAGRPVPGPALPQPLPARAGVAAASRVRLTPREEEVLALMVRGLKDRQIAEAMGLSYETVRNYVKTVRGKLGGGSRVETARRYWAP